jgi:protease secretion system membrane fusion protein
MNKSIDASNLPAINVEAEPAADESLPTDTRRIARFGLLAIGVGFGGFLLWAAFAPLDEGVPTAGTVSVDTKRKAVQHLQGGLVREVLVREGQSVEAGQVVIRLDDAVTRANYESSRQRYMELRAAESRLMAEQLGLPAISFHPELLTAAKSDPLIQLHINAQNQLLQSRRASLAASLGAIDESIQGQRALIEGYQGVLASRSNQAALYEREVKGVRDLVAEGYAPFNKQMELERAIADISASTADVQANQARARSAILELRQRALGLRSDYRKEIDTHMAEVRRDVQAEAGRFKAISEELARTEIRTPASGQVVGLAVQTVGGVVQAGQKLMDVVPHDERLVLETKVTPTLIDRVNPGAKVDVRFAAFAHSPQLVVDGVVDSISADIITDPGTTIPYYLARVSITPAGMKTLGKRQLQPGMPVEVVIKTGERSVLTYLLHPLMKRVAASMKEE